MQHETGFDNNRISVNQCYSSGQPPPRFGAILQAAKTIWLQKIMIIFLEIWKKYHKMRYFDAFSLYQITDKLNSFFTFEGIVSKSIKKTGFNIIDNNKILNAIITNYAMGNKL